jgi:hypothetical protein
MTPNRQRHKTNEQIGREYETLKVVYHNRASRQGQRTDCRPTSGNTLPEVEKPTIQAASAIGVSRPHADKAAAVVDVIDHLRDDGREREAGDWQGGQADGTFVRRLA